MWGVRGHVVVVSPSSWLQSCSSSLLLPRPNPACPGTLQSPAGPALHSLSLLPSSFPLSELKLNWELPETLVIIPSVPPLYIINWRGKLCKTGRYSQPAAAAERRGAASVGEMRVVLARPGRLRRTSRHRVEPLTERVIIKLRDDHTTAQPLQGWSSFPGYENSWLPAHLAAVSTINLLKYWQWWQQQNNGTLIKAQLLDLSSLNVNFVRQLQ